MERERRLNRIKARHTHLWGKMAGIECAMGVLCGEEVASALLLRYVNCITERDELRAEAIELGHGGALRSGRE